MLWGERNPSWKFRALIIRPWNFLFLVLAFLSTAHSQNSPSRSFLLSLSERRQIFLATRDTLIISLPDSFIISHSETLRCDTTIFVRGRDYAFDYGRARLTWFGNATTCDSLRFTYRVLPVRLPRRFFLFDIKPLREDSATSNSSREITTAQASRVSRLPNTNLSTRGSLTRGLSLGSEQALKVDSGLRMQISGNLSEGVEVLASLTDQNTPIQPEGNTQTLQEIDKVFVQIKSARFNATLGDFELAYGNSEFARYSRKLQGARLELGRGATSVSPASPFNFTISGATSRGQYTSLAFSGIEGNQGPYQLRGERGQIDLIILAGTERVWLDGEPLTRGENNDYVIDYASAQITFTRKRLITADSRLTIDFQYSDERFRRNLYSAQASASAWQRKLNWQTTLLRESDDKDNPLGFALSQNDLDSLAAAGNGVASRSGVTRPTAPERGDYNLRADSVWVYVGRDSGEYDVRFSDVGEGNGDYGYRGFGHFEYVGKRQARYLPIVLLTPARQHEVLDHRLELKPLRGVALISELALSRLDLNQYSSLNDEDNSGQAALLALQIDKQKLRVGQTALGEIDVQLRYRNKSERYRDIDRSDAVEFDRRWNLSSAQANSREEIWESRLNYAPILGWKWSAGLGSLQRGIAQNSSRWEIGTTLNRARWPELRYQIENIAREETNALNSKWLRQRGNVNWPLWKLRPQLGYEAEDRKDAVIDSTGGFRFESLTAGMGAQVRRGLNLSFTQNERRDDARNARGLLPKSVANTQNYALRLEQWKNFTLGLNYTHRERKFEEAKLGNDTRTDLADVQAQYAPLRRGLTTDWHYQITNTQAARQERVFLSVPRGEGNYRFDDKLNDYVPDPVFGDYILRVLNTEDFVPVVEVRVRGKLRLKLAQVLGEKKPQAAPRAWWQRYLAPLSTETFVRLEERTQESDVWEIYRLNLARFQNDSTTLFGAQSVQHDVHVWENQRSKSVRYRFTALRELNQQLLEGRSERTQALHELRLTLALSPKWSSQTELKLNNENVRVNIAGRKSRLVRSRSADVELSYRPRPLLELANVASVLYDRDLFSDKEKKPSDVLALSLRPRLTYSLRGKGRLSSELEWVQVQASPKGQVLPYELARGNREGTTLRWNLAFEYRVSSNVNFSLSYLGRKEADRSQIAHLGKMEMRAGF